VLRGWRGRSEGEEGWPSAAGVTRGAVLRDPGIRGSPADGDSCGPVWWWEEICS